MKTVFILLSIILMISCKERSEDPTVFEGKVIFADDGSTYSQDTIIIQAVSDRFIFSLEGSQEAKLDDKGEFSFEFIPNEEIGRFELSIKTGTGSITQGKGLNCSPYDCDRLEPGKRYTDLVIRVPR